jgi:hypothetical protein
MNVTNSWSPEGRISAKTGENAHNEPKRPSLLFAPFRALSWQRSLLSEDRSVSGRLLLGLSAGLGLFSFAALLASHNIADWDLWAKLALGAHVWHFGTLPHHDVFAFTPVLPEYVDHEWGAGTIFFGLLKCFGPASLMWLKIALASGTVIISLAAGRRAGCGWPPLFFLAIPAAGCVLFGYVPVIRSHAFTFFFFAIVLFCLEEIVMMDAPPRRAVDDSPNVDGPPSPFARGERRGERFAFALPWNSASSAQAKSCALRRYWPAMMIPGIILIWVNVHGGFVAGLGTIGVYTALSFWPTLQSVCSVEKTSQSPISAFIAPLRIYFRPRVRAEVAERQTSERTARGPTIVLLAVAFASLALTCVNPYGLKFWSYLLPAVMAKRPSIREWQPLPLFGLDMFVIFRALFLLVVCSLVAGWKRVEKKSWTGLIMLAITAFLAWRSRRHLPFFGIAALAFAGPYLEATLLRLCSIKSRNPVSVPSFGMRRLLTAVAGLYLVLGLYAATVWVPQDSLQVLAPIGDDPVREADILTRAQAEGNLAIPFNWGSYTAWRLYPKIKVSMDGRYEAAFPESTFQLNTDFFEKRGPAWNRLIQQHPVDYIILDLSQGRLRPEDLLQHGYVLVWQTPGLSALMALQKHAPRLIEVAKNLPPTTINPLDASIAENWWR